jgi:hypothetical protein
LIQVIPVIPVSVQVVFETPEMAVVTALPLLSRCPYKRNLALLMSLPTLLKSNFK